MAEVVEFAERSSGELRHGRLELHFFFSCPWKFKEKYHFDVILSFYELRATRCFIFFIFSFISNTVVTPTRIYKKLSSDTVCKI